MADSLTKTQLEVIFATIASQQYKLSDYGIFIETGTADGETTFEMAKHFKQVHTIEIQKSLYDNAIQKRNNLNANNVFIHFGDSSKLLPELLKRIPAKVIFYLDGHWSRGNTGRGDKDVPLLEELITIDVRNQNDIIIIDDFRLFGTTQWEDWKDITVSNICKCFKNKKIITSFSINDRYVICT